MLDVSRLSRGSVLTILGRGVGAARFSGIVVVAAPGRSGLGDAVEVYLDK